MAKSNERRLKKSMRKFRHKTVNYSKYVKDFYVENQIAFISCSINDYYDVINPYSVDEYEWLNEQFANYIESNAYYIPTQYPIIVELCGKQFNSKEKETICETISDYYSLKLADKQIDIENNTHRIISNIFISLIGFGIMFLSKVFFTDWAILELSNIIFWILIWRIADNIFDRRELISEKTEMAQLASIEVRFSRKFVDKVDEKKVEEFFEDFLSSDESE